MLCNTLFKPRRAFASLSCLGLAIALFSPADCRAQSKDLGNGFLDHGVSAPISNHRGIVCTVDGDGKNVVLAWLMHCYGGYAMLMVDAETGKAEQFPIPFKNEILDSPFASLLSSKNRFYTHYGNHFVEFDPVKRAFTFSHKTTPQMSMGMAEDDNGVIWSVSYPGSAVCSYNPETKEFRDYGVVYKQDWPQYQRHVAADDAGWVYFGIGMTATQIVAFDPTTSSAKGMFADNERKQGGTALVYRNLDGKVYGQLQAADDADWYELYKGEMKKIGKHTKNPKPVVTSSQALYMKDFPDGKKLADLNLVERKITVVDPKASSTKTMDFDYTSEGAMIMSVAKASDGTICGGTAFPMRFFSYDPKTDRIINRPAYGQWNIVETHEDKWFVGGYPSGYLLEWDPAKPWKNTVKDDPAGNPVFHQQITPVVHRPHCLLPLADGSKVIMGGTPQYGYTGGGLLVWDRNATTGTVLNDTDLVPDQSARSLAELPGNIVLVGTTIEAGTGGARKAKEAKLYLFDANTNKKLEEVPGIKGTQIYTALYNGPEGLVYGIADQKTLFVYDVVKKQIVHQADFSKELGRSISPQGTRAFVKVDDKYYVLLKKGIALLDTKTYGLKLVAESPVEIEAGGAYDNGRIYFTLHSHLYSWKISGE